MESGAEFVAVDNPHANKLTIHILAAVAEHEREAISERIKAALAAAKARGTRLGTPGPGRCRTTHGQGSEGQDESIRGQRLAYCPRNPECPAHKLQRSCGSAPGQLFRIIAAECTRQADMMQSTLRVSRRQTTKTVTVEVQDNVIELSTKHYAKEEEHSQ